jgi:hypothetical protein
MTMSIISTYTVPTENWKITIVWIATENLSFITMHPLKLLDLQDPNIYALFRCVTDLVLLILYSEYQGILMLWFGHQ